MPAVWRAWTASASRASRPAVIWGDDAGLDRRSRPAAGTGTALAVLRHLDGRWSRRRRRAVEPPAGIDHALRGAGGHRALRRRTRDPAASVAFPRRAAPARSRTRSPLIRLGPASRPGRSIGAPRPAPR